MGIVHFLDATTDTGELTLRGARVAQALMRRGVSPGDSVALLLGNSSVFIEALSCIRCLQATRVLLPWPLTSSEVGRLLDEMRAKVLICHSDLLRSAVPMLANRPALIVISVDPGVADGRFDAIPGAGSTTGETGWLQWEDLIAQADGALPQPLGARHTVTLTSGSTGRPKVVHRPGAQRWAGWYRHAMADRPALRTSIVTAPLSNSGQFGVFSQAFAQDANLVLLPTFEPEAFLAAVERFRVNHAYLVPAMFVRLLKLSPEIRARYDVRSLNYVVHSGGPCAVHVKMRMIEWWGPILWEAYGCSETSLISECSTAEWVARVGTVGRPIVPISIFNDAGQPLPAGATGYIHVDLATLPDVTVDGRPVPCVIRQSHRWFPTGDSGYLDADGYLYVVARTDELINSGGIKCYPIEIENALIEHPAVIDCVAFPLPDVEFGVRIGAVAQVIADAGPDDRQLRAFLTNRLPPTKVPSCLWVQRQPLRTAAGKFNRRGLRDRLLAG